MSTGEADEATAQRARLVRLYAVMGHLRVIAEVAGTRQTARAVPAAQNALCPVIGDLGATPTPSWWWLNDQETLR